MGIPPHLDLLNRKLIDVAFGRIDRLLLTLPPRHGKSESASHYFPTWLLGRFPDKRVILASYEARFAESWGRKVRNTLVDCCERGIFAVRPPREQSAAADWGIEGHTGGMVTAGVGGSITGRGAHLLIIDDPVKNAEEAMSPARQAHAWDWYNSTALTRLEPGGACILIQTRWAVDDLAGRILSDEYNDPQDIARWTHFDFPAIAEEEDAIGRKPGEALWPERYSVDDLEAARRRDPFWFHALYQQHPTARGGGFFKGEWFHYIDELPPVVRGVRYWDLAATEAGGDWTVGVLMHLGADGNYYIADVVRGQYSPNQARQAVCSTAEADGPAIAVRISEDPGQAGKDQLASYQREPRLQRFDVKGCRETGSKAVRAAPFASKCEAGMVHLLRGPWNRAFVGEYVAWNPIDQNATDDQIDAGSGAFRILTTQRQTTKRVPIARQQTHGV